MNLSISFFILSSFLVSIYFVGGFFSVALANFSARLLFTSIRSAVNLPSFRVHIVIRRRSRKTASMRTAAPKCESISLCVVPMFFRALKAIYVFVYWFRDSENVVCQISEIGFCSVRDVECMQASAFLFAGCIIDKLWNTLYGFRKQ